MLRCALVAAFLSAASAGTTEAGLAWLKENGQKEGVKTLDSGLQYKVCAQV